MSFFDELLHVLFPAPCPLCHTFHECGGPVGLCSRCEAGLNREPRIALTPPSLVRCWSLGMYDGPHGELVRLAKYGRSLAVADQLGRWLGEGLRGRVDVDAVAHVPVPAIRMMRRGFDQAERLACGVARATGLPALDGLTRRDSREQAGRSAAERRSMGMRAFGLRPVSLPERILLVDDVLTTGATMHAAARVLKRGGAAKVWGAVIASA